jgi:hypothetical protein
MTDKEPNFFSNHAWVAYVSPFRLIVPDGEEPLKVDLDEINSNTYNHGKLCRIVGMLPTLEFTDFKMIVCYDGALAIPQIGSYKKKEASVEFFNKIICQLLLGGVLCEALDTRDIVWGQLHDKRALWPVNFGESASSHLHSKLRMRVASNIDSIILSQPNFIRYRDFQIALDTGKTILGKIPNITPSFLIRGFTEIKYKNWSLALASLWITIEQLTDYLWNEYFLIREKYHPNEPISGRIKAMRNDNRTWSTSVKQEILFQTQLISEDIFQKLYPARQARNRLVHDGNTVEQNIAIDACQAVISMLRICVDSPHLPIQDINLFNAEPVVNGDREFNYDEWVQLSQES